MSREEAIDYLKHIEENYDCCYEEDALEMAIKALEQEQKTDILEQIKNEINEEVLESLSDGGDDWFTAEKVNDCLDIIDRHMEVSE